MFRFVDGNQKSEDAPVEGTVVYPVIYQVLYTSQVVERRISEPSTESRVSFLGSCQAFLQLPTCET